MRKILTVIPVRSGSVGIRNKNIQLLSGKPLLYYAIQAAKNAPGISKIIVSTDSIEYKEIAESFGVTVPFLRPPDLSGSQVRLHHVMKHALDYYDSNGEKYDAVMSLQATVPLIKTSTIEKVIQKFHSTSCEAVATATEIRHGHPYIAKLLDGNDMDRARDFITLDHNVERYPRQVRPPAYYFNGAVFLRDRALLDTIDETTNCLGFHPRVVLMDDYESVNIDLKFDLEIAESILRSYKDKNEL